MSARFVGLLLIVVLGGAAGYYWWQSSAQQSEVRHQLVLYGNVDYRQAYLAMNATERVAELLVDEGDLVRPGQLLARLETERFALEVQRVQALLEAQRQRVARLKAGSRPEEIRKARADLQAAIARRNEAQRTLKRMKAAFAQGAVNQQEVDDAQAAYDTAAATVAARQATLDLVVAGPRIEDILEAEALLRRYEAELALARHVLRDAHLYAPSQGIIQARLLEVGDMCTPQTPVFAMALLDPIWVRVYVEEKYLGRIWEGMEAVVTTDSYPGKKYHGRVGFIASTAEFTPKTVQTEEVRTALVYQVRVLVDNPEFELRLGMPATVWIDLNQPKPNQSKPSANKPAAGADRTKPALPLVAP